MPDQARPGDRPLVITVTERHGDGRARVLLPAGAEDLLQSYGEAPLPPYIHARLEDVERYQTVYSRESGSAAAPTAGLHLSLPLLSELRNQGTKVAEVTLNIGLDTFRPVTVKRLVDHVIHREWCAVPQATAETILEGRDRGGRVVAIGTTTARTLESWAHLPNEARAGGWSGWTDIFITPGYRWTMVDALLTNFHLPKSTLLMMIHSFAGAELAKAAYAHAIQERYRFYSFGDGMLIV